MELFWLYYLISWWWSYMGISEKLDNICKRAFPSADYRYYDRSVDNYSTVLFTHKIFADFVPKYWKLPFDVHVTLLLVGYYYNHRLVGFPSPLISRAYNNIDLIFIGAEWVRAKMERERGSDSLRLSRRRQTFAITSATLLPPILIPFTFFLSKGPYKW